MNPSQYKVTAEDAGILALPRLVMIAQQGNGQSARVARFLLALNDARRYPFDMRGLLGFEQTHFEDCLIVLRMSYKPQCCLEECYENGHNVFEELAHKFGNF